MLCDSTYITSVKGKSVVTENRSVIWGMGLLKGTSQGFVEIVTSLEEFVKTIKLHTKKYKFYSFKIK